MAALSEPYEAFLARNGGVERCGICGKPPPPNRRLDRDHDHATGKGRALLCRKCNRLLSRHLALDWLRAAIAYLERTESN